MSANAGAIGVGCCLLSSCGVTAATAYSALGAAFGYLGAHYIKVLNPAMVINPTTGAIFGATFALVDVCAKAMFACCCNKGNITCGSSIVSAVIAAFTTKFILEAAMGITLTGQAVLVLAGSTIAAELVIAAAVVCCCGALFVHLTKLLLLINRN